MTTITQIIQTTNKKSFLVFYINMYLHRYYSSEENFTTNQNCFYRNNFHYRTFSRLNFHCTTMQLNSITISHDAFISKTSWQSTHSLHHHQFNCNTVSLLLFLVIIGSMRIAYETFARYTERTFILLQLEHSPDVSSTLRSSVLAGLSLLIIVFSSWA